MARPIRLLGKFGVILALVLLCYVFYSEVPTVHCAERYYDLYIHHHWSASRYASVKGMASTAEWILG